MIAAITQRAGPSFVPMNELEALHPPPLPDMLLPVGALSVVDLEIIIPPAPRAPSKRVGKTVAVETNTAPAAPKRAPPQNDDNVYSPPERFAMFLRDLFGARAEKTPRRLRAGDREIGFVEADQIYALMALGVARCRGPRRAAMRETVNRPTPALPSDVLRRVAEFALQPRSSMMRLSKSPVAWPWRDDGGLLAPDARMLRIPLPSPVQSRPLALRPSAELARPLRARSTHYFEFALGSVYGGTSVTAHDAVLTFASPDAVRINGRDVPALAGGWRWGERARVGVFVDLSGEHGTVAFAVEGRPVACALLQDESWRRSGVRVSVESCHSTDYESYFEVALELPLAVPDGLCDLPPDLLLAPPQVAEA